MSARGGLLLDDWLVAGQVVLVADVPVPVMERVPVDGGWLHMVVLPTSVPERYQADIVASVICGWLRDQHSEEDWRAMVRARVRMTAADRPVTVYCAALVAGAPPAGAAEARLLAAFEEFRAERARVLARAALSSAEAEDDDDAR